jgi:hypothetical protein
MNQVKIVNKDNTESVYDVTYTTAYVAKVINTEHVRLADGKECKVKTIYVDDVMMAQLNSDNILEHINPGRFARYNAKSNEREYITVDIPSTEYVISTTANGIQVTYYQ